MKVNVITCKWGTKYGPHYVNRLKEGIERNLQAQHDLQFYCYTDDGKGLASDIMHVPFPNIKAIHPQYWFGTETYRHGLARCWDRAKTVVFNSHNFLNTSGRFLYLDLDVIVQNDIEPLLTYNMAQPTMLRSWWENPQNVQSRSFITQHGTIWNGSCQVWSDDQCEVIWKDVLENQDKIWFTYTGGTDNYHYWRWRNLWDNFPSTYAYSFNRGRDWAADDVSPHVYRPDCILCVFNVDVVGVKIKDHGTVKQDDLSGQDELLRIWAGERL